MKHLLTSTLVLLMLLALSCNRVKNPLTDGPHLGIIQLDNSGNIDVPFNIVVSTHSGKTTLTIRNADELITVDEVEIRNDSLHAKLPVFTSELIFSITNDSLKGYYYPKGVANGVRYNFYALTGETDRFPWHTEPPAHNITGRWWFIENPGTEEETKMIAELKQNGSTVVGTILSTTGDYRYLEGKVAGSKFYFSKNDGAQTIIVKGDIANDSTMNNGIISGSPRWVAQWIATRDESAALPESHEIVRVKKGHSKFEFAGVNLKGETIKSTDSTYRGKVIAVLAGGSWCPNCLDECRYYKELHNKYKDSGFEVVSLCFEDKTFEAAKPKIERFAKSIGANFQSLYVAPRGRTQRDSVLYPIEGQMAYPTSLILDKNGAIRRVETGFSGQGTGEHFNKFAQETEALIVKLLAE